MEPVGDPLVQRRPAGLRRSAIDRVAKQEVTEAGAVVAGRPCAGPARSGACGAGSRIARRRRPRRRVPRAAPPRTPCRSPPRLGAGALAASEVVDPGGQDRLDRRRDLDLGRPRREPAVEAGRSWPRRRSSMCRTCSTNSGLPAASSTSRSREPVRQRVAGEQLEQGSRLLVARAAAGRSSSGRPRCQSARRSSSSKRAMQTNRTAPRPSGPPRAGRSSSSCSAQWRSSRTTITGPRSASASSRRRIAQHDCSPGSRPRRGR